MRLSFQRTTHSKTFSSRKTNKRDRELFCKLFSLNAMSAAATAGFSDCDVRFYPSKLVYRRPENYDSDDRRVIAATAFRMHGDIRPPTTLTESCVSLLRPKVRLGLIRISVMSGRLDFVLKIAVAFLPSFLTALSARILHSYRLFTPMSWRVWKTFPDISPRNLDGFGQNLAGGWGMGKE